MTDLTCYKALRTCLWFRFKSGNFSGLKVADSMEGMFSHDTTLVTNSIFIGQSANFGAVEKKLAKGLQLFGFRNYLNPSLLSGVVFKSFSGPSGAGGGVYALVRYSRSANLMENTLVKYGN